MALALVRQANISLVQVDCLSYDSVQYAQIKAKALESSDETHLDFAIPEECDAPFVTTTDKQEEKNEEENDSQEQDDDSNSVSLTQINDFSAMNEDL